MHTISPNSQAIVAGDGRSAAQFCLLSAAALLGVTQMLLNRSAAPSPSERLQDWNDLSELTKEAGRSAYRAALILADPERAVPLGY
jgi:2-iminoacetate synthase ThiH